MFSEIGIIMLPVSTQPQITPKTNGTYYTNKNIQLLANPLELKIYNPRLLWYTVGSREKTAS